MRIKGIVIDPFKGNIEYECEFESERIEGMYYKVWKRLNPSTYANPNDAQLIPVAYVYPIIHTEAIKELLKELNAARKTWDDTQAKVFYKELPKYRLG